jgi:hypothetical protein
MPVNKLSIEYQLSKCQSTKILLENAIRSIPNFKMAVDTMRVDKMPVDNMSSFPVVITQLSSLVQQEWSYFDWF